MLRTRRGASLRGILSQYRLSVPLMSIGERSGCKKGLRTLSAFTLS